MMTKKIQFVLLSSALFALVSSGATAKCKTSVSKGDFVYAVGSSTLGSPLAGQLDAALKKEGLKFRKWAKASSGLARPDFHDWPAQIPAIEKEWSPDIFIISLGTNDYQALSHGKRWVKHGEKDKWIKLYTERVDRMLALAAGKDKKRMVVWVGPVPFNTPKGRNMSLRINRILKERIKAFDGNAHFVDMRSVLMSKNRPKTTFKDGRGKTRKTFRKDNVHLTIAAVQHLMTKRIVKTILSCRQN